jgi:hypothetical protein
MHWPTYDNTGMLELLAKQVTTAHDARSNTPGPDNGSYFAHTQMTAMSQTALTHALESIK